jgi:hypothetical protein
VAGQQDGTGSGVISAPSRGRGIGQPSLHDGNCWRRLSDLPLDPNGPFGILMPLRERFPGGSWAT